MPPVAVVTGGNSGLGFAICKGLARLSYSVVLASRDSSRGAAAAFRLKKEHSLDVESRILDVTSSASVAEFVSGVLLHHARIDVLVNNAGVSLDADQTLLELDQPTLDATFRTNLLGPLLMCQAIVPGMVANKFGRVVNISSGLGQLSSMGSHFAAYRMSKASLNALTRIVHDEVSGGGGCNVLVNSMCPGFVKTPMTSRSHRVSGTAARSLLRSMRQSIGCPDQWTARAVRGRWCALPKMAQTLPFGWRHCPPVGLPVASSETESKSSGDHVHLLVLMF